MKTISLGMAILSVLLLTAVTPLWAGTARTVSVSCVVEPRSLAQMEQKQDLNPQANNNLLQQQETKKTGLPLGFASAIVYSYCAR